MQNIRNFSIIAHIDHGKSTLADRLLEFTHTVENRKMKDQVLDSMDLERERGITIKMTPVRMDYKNHILNLIDTPGHIDFSYEVSRSLRAVEGALLLVDATQGVQAQTLTTLEMAKHANLKIIPVINKIDSPLADIEGVKNQIIKLLSVEDKDIILVSGKTGEGVERLLEEILTVIPPPHAEDLKSKSFRALIFDFEYSNHEGVILYVRVLNGSVKRNDELSNINNIIVIGKTSRYKLSIYSNLLDEIKQWTIFLTNGFVIEKDNKYFLLLLINSSYINSNINGIEKKDKYFVYSHDDDFWSNRENKTKKIDDHENNYYILEFHYTNLTFLFNDSTSFSSLFISLIISKNLLCICLLINQYYCELNNNNNNKYYSYLQFFNTSNIDFAYWYLLKKKIMI